MLVFLKQNCAVLLLFVVCIVIITFYVIVRY